MLEQVIKIVQVDNPILNNLATTENKLNELNQEVGVIIKDYNSVNQIETSFFNFDNPFFLLTLIGLFMLVFALWFLKKELKFEQNKKKFRDIKKVDLEIEEKIKREEEAVKIQKSKITKKTIRSKGRKIKVIKVK